MWSNDPKWFTLLDLIFAVAFVAQSVGPVIAADDLSEVEISEIRVPMSDGIELATTVYRPKNSGPFPVIVARTPYNKDGLKGEAQRFCKNGWMKTVSKITAVPT